MRRIAHLALVSLMLMVLFAPMVSAQPGPEIDVLRYVVIRSPAAQLTAMLTGQVDVLTQRTNPTDIETLFAAGNTITADLGFHISFIGFNIRADQSYRRPGITFWPLSDVNFRHALAHTFDKLGILPPLGGYVKTPLNSMVPPSLSQWYNPNVQEHPYNLGDPFATTVYDPATGANEDACSILRYGGYTFVDADSSGDVTNADYWRMPNGEMLPKLIVYCPLEEVDPQKQRIIVKWLLFGAHYIGLAAAANGNSGLVRQEEDFSSYANKVYGANTADFDVFIINFKLNRFPDYLYDWFHSSQDSLVFPGAYNAFGVHDPVLDGLLETMKFSLAHNAKMEASHAAQERLADGDQPWGLPVLPVYSMSFFNTFNPNLRGIVKSPGYGSGDGGCVALKELDGPIPSVWTYTNIRWALGTERLEGGKTVVVWGLSDEPESFNPLYAMTTSAWEVMDRVFDPLITVSPYNHEDKPWLAVDWAIGLTATGMDVTYYLRDDVYWQDGRPYTAYDAEFSLEFIRNWQIWKYKPTWEHIVDVEVINPTTFTVHSDSTSQFLIYDWAVLAALLPPQIWDRAWADKLAVLNYDPTEPYNVAPGYTAGPNPPPTNLFGTGPWIFQIYDASNLYGDLWANRNYFLTTAEIRSLKTEMFWEVGDVDRDGHVWAPDLYRISVSYGYFEGEPQYDPDADLDQNGIVDIMDFATAAFHFDQQKEYP